MIKLDLSKAMLKEDILSYQEDVTRCHKWMDEKTGKGNDFVGWVRWPEDYDKEEFARILDLKKRLEGKYDVVLVCGVGGSYLGTRACEEMVKGLYPNEKKELIYIGNTFSHTYIAQILNYIRDKEVVLNVISKSGTTTETSLAFRIFKKFMEVKYGIDAKERIIATTDKEKGTLKSLADKEGYETFVIPDDIGGRFSVFTPVGLVPLALAGIDIEALMEGSRQAMTDFSSDDLNKNDAYKYAVARRILDNQGYKAEMFVTYHPQLAMVAEWWKQLFGESEGKDGKGLLPTSACFTTDLHSLGQFIQQGQKGIEFETVMMVDEMPNDIVFPSDKDNYDLMNYLSGKKLSWVNEMAFEGTLGAHYEDGQVPNIVLRLKDNSAYSFGYMIYFFFRAVGMTCYLLDINPFDQPGVEVYKKRMFKLLGKE